MSTFTENFRKQFDILKDQEMYFKGDMRNVEYFAKNPKNDNKDEIRLKISAINNHEINDNDALEAMTEHIVKLNIDKRLTANDLNIVEDIANITVKGKQMRLLNFASVYCNYHKPDVYPIYGKGEHREIARRYIKEQNLNVNPDQLDRYLVMKQVLDDIIKRFLGDKEINYLEARKFGWLYLDKVIRETQAQEAAAK